MDKTTGCVLSLVAKDGQDGLVSEDGQGSFVAEDGPDGFVAEDGPDGCVWPISLEVVGLTLH